MQQIATRDVAAFESLYLAHRGIVFGIGLRMLGDAASAEDLSQSVFLKVWRNPQAYKGGYFTGWISRVARNHGLDVLRQRVAFPEAQIAGDLPLDDVFEDQVIRDLDVTRVRKALAQLPRNERVLIVMGFFGGVTHDRLAAITCTPLGTVKTRIRTGLHRLRRALEDDPPCDSAALLCS